jgi:N-acylneuraminate cytidylyltransferase
LARLTQTGIPVLVLSAETSGVVAARCRKLGLECRQGCQDKLSAMRTWLAEREIPPEQTVYLGNDANDVACLGAVGCGVAVADAYPEALAAARVVLQNPGGSGAIRELLELLIAKREGRLGA